MAKNARLLYATTRPRDLNVACSFAMSRTPEWVICDDAIRIFAHITFGTHGISVPISRGSPPVLTE